MKIKSRTKYNSKSELLLFSRISNFSIKNTDFSLPERTYNKRKINYLLTI